MGAINWEGSGGHACKSAVLVAVMILVNMAAALTDIHDD